MVASSNERVWIVADLLKKYHGYEYEIIPAAQCTVKKILATLWSAYYNALVVHKSLFRWQTIALFVFARFILRKSFFYDLDDAQWLHSPRKSAVLAWMASGIFAGSQEIIAWAKRYNNNVVWIPTAVFHEEAARCVVRHRQKDIFTIGWIGGGPAHFRRGNLALVRPALEELGKRGYRFCFLMIGTHGLKELEDYFISPFFELKTIPLVPYDDIFHYISEFDIGIMPLVDEPFERGKCAAKAIQYMACGVPPVVSPVGENMVVVEQGKTGFLASTTEEWVNAFETLLNDVALRNAMGQAGMQKVARFYSFDVVVKKYAALIKTP